MVAVVIFAGGEKPSSSQSSSRDRVSIEFRATPTAVIRVDGKKVGETPMALQFPKSTKEIVVQATMVRHLISRTDTKDETYVDERRVTLDRDRSLDFKIGTAKLTDTSIAPLK